MNIKINPQGRRSNIIVQKLASETLIYDLMINKAFCLNQTSAIAFQLCDGENSVRQIADAMTQRFGRPVNDDVVLLALNGLSKNGLLEEETGLMEHLADFSRREVIRKVGFASLIALPIVTSIIAPNPITAQSCSANNVACASDPNCCSGNCLATPNFGTNCCAAGSINGIPPGNNAFCTGSDPVCSSQAVQFCCSGSGALGSPGACPTATSQCICD